jgi:hypothetical protein
MNRFTRVLGAAAAITLIPAAALAAPGGKQGGGESKGGGGKASSTFVIPDGVYGGTTNATVSNAPDYTWIESSCYQDGSPVIYNRLEVGDDGTATLTLGPTTGYVAGVGGADCEAEAKYWHLKRQKWVPLGHTAFHVSDA